MIHLDTAELVLLAQAGDRPAFGELVRRFQATVFAVAMEKLRDEPEAQELTHETFVRALTKLAQLREPAAFPGWIRQIAVRLALNRLTRRRRLAQAEEAVLENASATEQSPLESLVREENRASVRAGLGRLNPLDRDTLTAFYVLGQSIREMSESFETPEGTIKRRLHVARLRLKAKLEAVERRKARRALALSY
jgi:RNA polymerase sigma-70 factor (ECF subfamily)